MAETTPPQITSLTETLLTSGLNALPTPFPMVSVSPTNSSDDQYSLTVQIYIPDTTVPALNMDISKIILQKTQAGDLNLRLFDITYPNIDVGITTYSLWGFIIIYDINSGPVSDGIYVQLTGWLPDSGGIPTSRGTVTIVATT